MAETEVAARLRTAKMRWGNMLFCVLCFSWRVERGWTNEEEEEEEETMVVLHIPGPTYMPQTLDKWTGLDFADQLFSFADRCTERNDHSNTEGVIN